jgi:hypothetical protein
MIRVTGSVVMDNSSDPERKILNAYILIRESSFRQFSYWDRAFLG